MSKEFRSNMTSDLSRAKQTIQNQKGVERAAESKIWRREQRSQQLLAQRLTSSFSVPVEDGRRRASFGDDGYTAFEHQSSGLSTIPPFLP